MTARASMAPGSSEASEDAPERLTGASPVELIPRLELRHRFVEPAAGGALNTTTFRMDVGLRGRALLRYELPMGTVAAGADHQTGFGDLRVEGLTLLTSGPRQVSILITGLVLDTASRPVLGAGRQQVVFGAGAAVKPLASLLVFGIAQQQLSVAGDERRPDVSELLVRTGAIIFGGQGDWYLLNLDPTIDFAAEGTRLVGTVEAGSLLVRRVGLFMRAGTQVLGTRQLDYFLEGGVRYLFRLDRPDRGE